MDERLQAGLILLVLVALAFALPVKYDPAFWLKDFNERWRKRMEK